MTWSWLGVEGRTAVLLLLTGGAATAAVVLAHRPLPVAAEALTTVALGLVALDVLGVRSSGWLGPLGGGGTTAVVGTAVGLASVALVAATRQRVAAPVAAQVGGALGLLLLAGGTVVATGHLTSTAAATVLAASLLAALAHRLDLRTAADAAAVVATAWWLGLTTVGLADAAAAPSVRGLVLDGAGAGLLSAGLLALLPLAHPAVRRSRVAGPAAVAVSTLLLTLLAVVPLADEGAGTLLVGCLVGLAAWTVVVAAAGRTGLRDRTAAIAAPQLVLALPAALVALDLVAAAVDNVARLAERVGSPGGVPLDAVLGSTVTAAAPALLVPTTCLVAVAGAVHLPARHRRTGFLAAVALAVPASAVALAAVPVPLALVVAVAAVPGLLAATAALVAPAALEGRHRTPLLLAAAGAAGTSLAAALPSAALTALVLLPVAVVAGQVALDGDAGTRTRTAADAALPLALGGLAWSVADVTGLAVADRALPVLLVVGALAVLRPRLAVELGATAAALPATLTALAAVAASPATSVTGSASVSLALHLTLAGALLAASAAMHPSRRLLAWPGGLLLAAATWVRLADLGVSAPEAYTLPTALVLVAVGVVRLRRDADAPTRTTLLPGLVLATLPSLLVVLAEDPVSPRAAALGLGCLVLLLAGARLRWSAPVVVGGAAGAVLVAAELVPYAAVVPQWLLLAAAGAVLTAVGVTWEDRSADARRAARYLVRLR
ncbi:hypothetical protein ENKNEFLB_00655 [Nocardioides aquaticus]|uniref:Uncharacterized protein n=1 Tax=Nocardioides aquaticus TaxID=160826 RepID=A0ABX8ECT5_9ACTN|nr:hypothetical protein [Nocardioides aquaticus]QVT78282.1 hypothetical protein ENKNEFLB_00655 [Nocardioides aquaticus]